MKNVRVTYYGPKENLQLEMQRFPRAKEIVTRMDTIMPQERKRHRDSLVVLGMDMSLINIGVLVPEEKGKAAIEMNPNVDDNYTGFIVSPPTGYTVVEIGTKLVVVGAHAVAEAEERQPKTAKKKKGGKGRRKSAPKRDDVRDSLMGAF